MHSTAYRPGAMYRPQIYYLHAAKCCAGYAGAPPDCNRELCILNFILALDYRDWFVCLCLPQAINDNSCEIYS